MQEEVENRTINLAISTTRLTARSIIAGIRKYLQHREKVKARKGTRDTAVHGKQSVKQLLGQNQGATNVEIDKDGIRDFERLARKYGVDFAVLLDDLRNVSVGSSRDGTRRAADGTAQSLRGGIRRAD